MEHKLYIEIYAFALAVVFILLHKIIRDVDKQHNQQLFKNVLINIMIMFSLDLLWKIIEEGYIPLKPEIMHEVDYWVNALYFIFAVSSSYVWLVYSESIQGNDILRRSSYMIISFIPMAVMIFLCVISYKTHWLFSIDENNAYQRGPLYLIQPVIADGYMLFTSIKALIKSTGKISYNDKKRLRLISSFIILPFVALLLQIITSLPMVCVGMSVSLISVYIHLQDDLISIDALTQINNRNQLYRYLFNIGKKGPNDDLYLLIMDVDKFKRINDAFGHVEGDRALKKIANALKKVAGKHDCFISRFGGDEFIVIYDAKNGSTIEEICNDINEFVMEQNKDADYLLTVSIGCARYNDSIKNHEELIGLADKELYKVKAAKKSMAR